MCVCWRQRDSYDVESIISQPPNEENETREINLNGKVIATSVCLAALGAFLIIAGTQYRKLMGPGAETAKNVTVAFGVFFGISAAVFFIEACGCLSSRNIRPLN